MSAELWTFDTEDDGKGNIYMIGFFNGTDHFTFHHSQITQKNITLKERTRRLQKKALEFIAGLDSTPKVFWAVNLQYDLVNTFGKHLYLPQISYVGSRVISANIPGTSIRFHDTLNHWKISVAEMGKKLGYPKMRTKSFDNIKYNQRDNEIVYRYVKMMSEKYESIGCKLKATISGTALEFFQTKYHKREKSILRKSELEFMRGGYYGGRTEIFFQKPVVGRIFYHDFNSLYPSVCLANLPVLDRSAIVWTKKPEFDFEGVCDVTVESPNHAGFIPYLPLRADNGGLIFPSGIFRGRYTYFEIREAKKLGYKIKKIHKALEFQAGSSPFLRQFMLDMYQNRLKAKAAGDEFLAEAFKLLMNALYGKYAQGDEYEKLVPHEGRPQEGDFILGDLSLRTFSDEWPEHTNYIWSMYITAFGRHRLYQPMVQVQNKGGLLVYVDTDSVLYENRKCLFKDSKKLGELKLERPTDSSGDLLADDAGNVIDHYEYVYFKLPKLYSMKAPRHAKKYKAKGIPKWGTKVIKLKNGKTRTIKRSLQKEFFETGKTKFKKPLKLREVLRRTSPFLDSYSRQIDPKTGRIKEMKRRKIENVKKTKLIPNYWVDTEKETRKEYDKRIVLDSGHTIPVLIKNQRRVEWKPRQMRKMKNQFMPKGKTAGK